MTASTRAYLDRLDALRSLSVRLAERFRALGLMRSAALHERDVEALAYAITFVESTLDHSPLETADAS